MKPRASKLYAQIKARVLLRALATDCPVMRRIFGKRRRVCDVHHVRGRLGALLTDERFMIAVSREGHRWIHDNPAAARRYGWLAQPGEWGKIAKEQERTTFKESARTAERTTHGESTIGLERTIERESAMLRERTKNAESATLYERTIQGESAIDCERTMKPESANAVERTSDPESASAKERTINDEL